MRKRLLLVVLAVSCGGEIGAPSEQQSAPRPEGQVEDLPPDRGVTAPDPKDPDATPRFIGSPCTRDEECNYEGGVCLTGGFSGGMCSLPCEQFCPDAAGFPVTFCVPIEKLPAGAAHIGMSGACVSRCDYTLYSGSGCRSEYGCIEEARENDAATKKRVCMPGIESTLSGCYEELAELGVDFEITERADDHPDGDPSLTCHIEDPVILHPPIHGVDLIYANGNRTPNVLASCRMALALVKTIDDMVPRGVVELIHYGTYNCRKIAGSSSLSRHGYGDAIDIVGFELANGTRYTVENDFEQDVGMPSTEGGRFLYDAVHRWHDEAFWNIILTPNYNAAHRDHFHCDLTPGSDYLNFREEYYVGPADYVD